MTTGLGFPDRKAMAELTAKMLLEVEAIRFMEDKPFVFTSGWASPVYTDCRRLISFPRVRQTLIDFGAATVCREAGFEQFDTVVGGETAGIPFAAWMADRLMLPMQYVRKKPKGFGRNAQIEGSSGAGPARAAGRGPDHRRPQQGQFLQRAARGRRHRRAYLRDLLLRHLSREREDPADLGITLHHLCTWWDVLDFAKTCGQFDPIKLDEIEKFLNDPAGWSKAHGGVAEAAE
jgi:orotate phosphoribosyltransferase